MFVGQSTGVLKVNKIVTLHKQNVFVFLNIQVLEFLYLEF